MRLVSIRISCAPVGKGVKDGTITSSPTPTPQPSSAPCSVAVPLAYKIPYLNSPNSRLNPELTMGTYGGNRAAATQGSVGAIAASNWLSKLLFDRNEAICTTSE